MDFNSNASATDSLKLFVGQIPKDINETELNSFFQDFGAIKDLAIIRDSNNVSKGSR